ncbi:peptidyl-prolyl cis-trans isomerase D [Steroidobacter denitrificans]|uniref:Periplasmic chaperone PpiD n=1 Tax=Steroidobacter denitrificans TaxID=465721 RepID=A0A127F9T7_STEDE|nr:SurA N-terminal domain-containing protein [Steroidobacter denitrificans]AMN46401.1 peptidyl-prolyl cis-trans isomerase D [Steroidobacter denitrificans]
MLQKIREKITGLVAFLFIGLIAVVFVFWGVDFGAGVQSYAAKVDGETISADLVRRAWQQRQSQLRQVLHDEIPEELLKSQQAALLEQFIQQSLLTQRARQFGYRVSDQALVERLKQVPAFQVDGEFSKDRYLALLRSSGMHETQFEADLQSELLITQLQEGIVESSFVTPQELDRRYALEQQAREVTYALIPASGFARQVEIDDAQVERWYQEHSADYLLPEMVDLQYLELTRARAEQAVEVTEQALREYYQQVKDRYESPEQRHGRHILITVDDGVSDAQARDKAQELTAQIKNGADFAALAKAYSKDPGSAQQGGDLGWAQRGMFVGPFEDALFGMSEGETRGPIKTQFGYHVLQLEGIRPGSLRSFEDARAEVEDEYRKERAQTIFYDETQKLGDEAFASLTELDSVAQSLDLPLQTLEGFTREGGGEFDANRDVIAAAFSEEVLDRRENSPLITIGEDRALVLRVTGHTPATPRPLAQVQEQIRATLKTQRMRELAKQQGEDAAGRLHQGESWAQVTHALGVDAIAARFVTRDDKVIPGAVLAAAFAVPTAQIGTDKPYIAGVTTDEGNYAVYAVSQARAGDPAAESEQERRDRRRRAERRNGNQEFSAYLAQAERRAKIVRNDTLFD